MRVIIYPNNDGTVAVMAPALECGLTIEQIAAKDVPPIKRREGTGQFDTDDDGEPYEIMRTVLEPRPYQIVDASELPQEPQEFWRWKDED